MDTMKIIPGYNGFYLAFENDVAFAGPYRREKDAKGQLTRLRRGYTPAARLVNE